MKPILKATLLVVIALLVVLGCTSESEEPQVDLPELSIRDTTVREGGTAVFRVFLSKTTTDTVWFLANTAEVTASGSDFLVRTGGAKVNINPGTQAMTITVKTLVDNQNEETETFKMVLSEPTNAALSDKSEATCSITQ